MSLFFSVFSNSVITPVLSSVTFCFCDAVANLSGSPTALQQKATRLLLKDAVDRDNVPTGRSFDRISMILDQIRRQDTGSVDVLHDNGHPTSVRAELDSFAGLINRLPPGSAAAVARPKTSARSDVEDFWTRMAHTRGDLAQLETLVSRTFGSPHQPVVSNSPPSVSVSDEPVFIFHDKKVQCQHDTIQMYLNIQLITIIQYRPPTAPPPMPAIFHALTLCYLLWNDCGVRCNILRLIRLSVSEVSSFL